MNETQNSKLLICIYQNTLTAIQSIENCINDIPSSEFLKEIQEELHMYKEFQYKVEDVAQTFSEEVKDNNGFEKARLWTSIKLNTLFDKSIRHYAQMFFLGTNMGIVNLIVGLCDNKDADEKIKDLANKLLQMEENYSVEMKKYIGCN